MGSVLFFFQAEDGIRVLVRSRGLGDVYKRQLLDDLLASDLQGGVTADNTLDGSAADGDYRRRRFRSRRH